MIEPEDYRMPHSEQPKSKPKTDSKIIAYLESLPWRPHGVEW